MVVGLLGGGAAGRLPIQVPEDCRQLVSVLRWSGSRVACRSGGTAAAGRSFLMCWQVLGREMAAVAGRVLLGQEGKHSTVSTCSCLCCPAGPTPCGNALVLSLRVFAHMCVASF